MRAPLRFLSPSFLALAVLLSASGSFAQTGTAWTTFKGDNARTGSSTAQMALPLSLQWRFSSDGPARSYNTTPLVVGAPGRQRVVFASGRNIYALDVATGQQLWRSPDLSANLITPLSLLSDENGDLILAAQSNGVVTALKANDGGRAWSTDTKFNISESGPLVIESDNATKILLATNTGRIVALDGNGKLDPSFNVALDQFGQLTVGSLTLSGDGSRVFAQLSDGRLFCVDVATGRVLWRFQLASRPIVTPVAASESVIAVSPGQVVSVSFRDGQPAWRFRPRGDVQGSPALQNDTLFFGTRNGYFQALDVRTGLLKWEKQFQNFNFTGSPLALPSVVVVGTSRGLLLGISPQNGDLLWEYRLRTEREVTARAPRPRDNTGGAGEGGAGAPAPAEAPAAPTDAPATSTRVFPVSSAPAVVDGALYVLGDNAALYAFTAQPFDADPPRALYPSLTVPDTRKNLISLDVVPASQQIVPGTGPIYFALELDDIGSGVDPSSLSATLDGEPIDAARLSFDPETGTVTIVILDPKNETALSDGVKTLILTARDYAGNQMTYNGAFLVDNTAPAPEPPIEETPPAEGNPGGAQQP